jgi:hypothetical protein
MVHIPALNDPAFNESKLNPKLFHACNLDDANAAQKLALSRSSPAPNNPSPSVDVLYPVHHDATFTPVTIPIREILLHLQPIFTRIHRLNRALQIFLIHHNSPRPRRTQITHLHRFDQLMTPITHQLPRHTTDNASGFDWKRRQVQRYRDEIIFFTTQEYIIPSESR